MTMDTPLRRLALITGGSAIVAMAAYHFSWDLAYHRLVDWDVAGDPVWRDFARTIAASFLAISGLSLVLARRAGADAGTDRDDGACARHDRDDDASAVDRAGIGAGRRHRGPG